MGGGIETLVVVPGRNERILPFPDQRTCRWKVRLGLLISRTTHPHVVVLASPRWPGGYFPR